MSRGGVSRADLLRALVKQGGVLSSSAITALGFSSAPAEAVQQQKPAANDEIARGENGSPTAVDDDLPLAPTPFWQALRYTAEAITAPASLTQSEKLTLPQRSPEPPPDYRYLAPFSALVPRLRAALSERRPSRAYDIPRLVEQLGRGDTPCHLPRRHWMGWGSNLYVIEDRSDHLAPYVRDQAMAQAHLRKLYVKTAFYPALYSELTDQPLVDRGSGFVPIELQAGDQVLILGDLGVLARDGGRSLAFWTAFGRQLRRVGAEAVALLPCSPRACPKILTACYQLLSWEHPDPQPLADDEQQTRGLHLLNQLAISGRIEPGLLREIRLTLGADDYPASLEAWVWQHPAMDRPDMVATALQSECVPAYRARFCADERRRHKTLAATQKWLRHLPYEIWLESVVELMACDWSDTVIDQQERDDALQLFRYLVGQVRAPDGAGLSVEALDWIEGFAMRLGERARQAEPIKALCWVLDSALARRREGLPAEAAHEPGVYRICQQGGQFTFQRESDSLDPAGTPIATMGSCDGRIEVEIIPQALPGWADADGEDESGRWIEFAVKGVRQRMRWIEPGTFLMGSPADEPGRWDDEGPQHAVTLTQGYWLFDTPVTQALWQAVMGENPSQFQSPEHPVEKVGWQDAQAFIARLNALKPGLDLSLPSEAQWEYACRADSETALYCGEIEIVAGNNAPALDEIAWYCGNSDSTTHSVKFKTANRWGLYDMLGNVWEWCHDGRRSYTAASATNPVGPLEAGAERVVRGGSWGSSARGCRSACRDWGSPDDRGHILGFRCARVQVSPEGAQAGRAEQVAQPAVAGGDAQAEPADHRARCGGAGVLLPDADGQSASKEIPAAGNLQLRSDRAIVTLQQRTKPRWASAMGRDRFGLWAEFILEAGQQAAVKQRMRWIPPGRFLMGSPESERSGLAKTESEHDWFTREGPQHEVTLTEGYWLFDTPVTQALWQAVMDENPSKFQSPERPVEQVSWQDAKGFIERLNALKPGLELSLPSEAQWEYACRAGSETALYSGEIEILGLNNAPALDEIAWYGGNSGVGFELGDGVDSSGWSEKQHEHTRAGSHPVKLKQANPWGLYDMLGNVWEWCEDGKRDYTTDAEMDPVGPLEAGAKRVIRGGSWYFDARMCRSACRVWSSPDSRDYFLGFRCARVQA